MAFKVFISYSTNDFPMVENVRRLLTNPAVEVYIAEYSAQPGSHLNNTILKAIKDCDMFVLLWSRNSKYSEYVPQEIGIARGANKHIMPIVLEEGLKLPAFINDLKYLPAYRNRAESMLWLQNEIFSRASDKQLKQGLIIFGVSTALVWLLSREE